MSTQPELTGDRITRDIAEILDLDPSAVDPDTPLTEQGLDSLRAVTLVENWRADGVNVDFQELMALPTLNGWITALTR